ncbi:MAG: MFS transporter, partial [Verrucomicrobia bacterium]|nr:MFS transporter [Verrucomicrobiota bacterium]
MPSSPNNPTRITSILAWWSVAYGFGQLINGLLTDRIGGRKAMLIGAVGTITINMIYGFSSTVGTFSTFALIWLMNGYFQSFGAPGMIKINAAWFNRTERGTFAGIFGLMIQSGQFIINNLAPFLLGGFAIFVWWIADHVGSLHFNAPKDEHVQFAKIWFFEPLNWRWLFIIPPMFTAVMAVLVVFIPKESPEAAGYPGLIHDENSTGDTGTRASIKDSFITIFTHPLVWFYAAAYACTGAVRNSSDQLAVLYFVEQLKLDIATSPAVKWTLNLMPAVAVAGSLASGIISDKFFKGHRSPVAMGLYFGQSVIILIAALIINTGVVGPTPSGIFLGCLFLILISLTVNSTHSLVGAAAPMDIGGRQMAG